MITKETIKAFKLTPKDLKPVFTSKKPSPAVQALVDTIRDRIQEGRDMNLRDYRYWWAMDVAYDAPFRQVSQTIFQQFCETLAKKDLTSADALKKAESWGLTKFITTRKNADGADEKCIDIPVMFKVIVPLVRAYVNIRWAKLWDLRDLVPFLKYEPVMSTTLNRVRCEIVTNAIEMQGQQMNYRSTGKQWIFNGIHYGTSIMFPAEDWYREQEYAKDEGGGYKARTKKAGLRYNLPHPSRTFFDQAHRAGTMNSDTGVEWCGYWKVVRYKNVRKNGKYWNSGNISMIGHDIIASNRIYFETVYPCTLSFPNGTPASTSGAGQFDREASVDYYSRNEDDRAVVLTDIFMKIVPSEYGLGDPKKKYDHPVWFRFVVANDDDVLYAAPLCYTPPLYIGYDAHEERQRNASLSLEIIPFQDQISNLLTQQILTAKNNLTRAVFWNRDMIGQEFVDQLQNKGEDFYRDLTFLPFSGRKVGMAQNDVRSAFYPVNFPVASIQELVSTMRIVLDMLERVLVFSAQEVGSTATHEQTAEEVRIIGGNVSTRLQLTNSFINDAWHAWKKQLYDALMAYGDEEIWSHVPAIPPVTEDILHRLGFTVVESGKAGVGSHKIRGNKSALLMESFVASREGADRINNPEVAASMAQITQIFMSNPALMQALGIDQLVELYNTISRMAGLPRDFKLMVSNRAFVDQLENPQPQQQGVAPEQLQQILQQMTVQILERAAEQTQEITGQAMQEMVGPIQDLQKAVALVSQQVPPLQQTVEQIMTRLEQITIAASGNASDQNPTGGTGGPPAAAVAPLAAV